MFMKIVPRLNCLYIYDQEIIRLARTFPPSSTNNIQVVDQVVFFLALIMIKYFSFLIYQFPLFIVYTGSITKR